jgi:glycosyltransferase involved in cell wall biosynthesis
MIDFSVIVPTYNNEQKIEGAVNSILRQSYDNWELIIVDDGSTDATEDKLKPFLEKDTRIQYIRQKNMGVAVARNTGVENARGEYICFMDSDDEVKERWLADFQDLKDPNTGYLSCGYLLNGQRKYPKQVKEISRYKYSSLAGCFALRKKVFQKIGGYDHNLKQSENWEMTARALEYCEQAGLNILHTNNPNFVYHHEKTPEQTRQRDEHRANATLYLHKKYAESGVLHFRKDDFLLSSAVNFLRAGNAQKSREIFHKILKQRPTLQNFIRILIFKIPFLRNRKWAR